jgi:hypothetical protein
MYIVKMCFQEVPDLVFEAASEKVVVCEMHRKLPQFQLTETEARIIYFPKILCRILKYATEMSM